ncbi:MAG: outer membrane protein [Waddliaceae bacterium]
MRKIAHFIQTAILSGLLIITAVQNVHASEGLEPMRSRHLSIGGGNFNPSDGESGTAFLGQFLHKNGNTRFGGEIEYRDFEATLFEVQKVETQSFIIRGVGVYMFRPEGISPYIGGGIGVAINIIDGDKIEQTLSQGNTTLVVVSDVGAGFGLVGLIGIEAPVSSDLIFFAEGRISGDFQLTQIEGLNTAGEEEIEIENLGGVTVLGGVRFRF